MIPPGLESAPLWAQNLFYGVMAIGAAYFAVKKITSGVKDENRHVRATGRPSSVEEVVEGPPVAPPLSTPALAMIGSGLVERQIAEDHLAIGRKLVNVLEALENRVAAVLPLFDRQLEILEYRLAQETEEDRREEMREELARLIRDEGLDQALGGDRGNRTPGGRQAPRRPR